MKFSTLAALLALATLAPVAFFGQSVNPNASKALEQDVRNNSNGNRTGDQARPIYVSGQIALSDGTVPQGRVAIERVCTSHTYQEGYADAKGHFNVQLGISDSTMPDASFDSPTRFGDGTRVGNGSGESGTGQYSVLLGCDLRAALPGYHSESIPLTGRRQVSNPDVGTILLRRMEKVDGYSTSASISLAPKDAKKAYEKAEDLLHKDKLADAQKELQHAVELYPKHAAAWYELGRVYEHGNQPAQARDAYLKAIDSDPNYVNPYERMYAMAVKENKWQEAADYSDKVLRLNPYEFATAYYFNALAHFQLKELDIAEKSGREAVKQTGKDAAAKAPYILAIILANKGNLPEAAENFKAYLKVVPPGPDKDRTTKMLAETEERIQALASQK
jgi:tetratricopeptide (TPR) repeat protein